MRWPVDQFTVDSPHTKANILLQAWMLHLDLPISDYYTDTKSILEQALRILQAMVDVCAENGWLSTTLKVMQLTQMIVQARFQTDSSLLNLPHMNKTLLAALWDAGIESLPELMNANEQTVRKVRSFVFRFCL